MHRFVCNTWHLYSWRKEKLILYTAFCWQGFLSKITRGADLFYIYPSRWVHKPMTFSIYSQLFTTSLNTAYRLLHIKVMLLERYSCFMGPAWSSVDAHCVCVMILIKCGFCIIIMITWFWSWPYSNSFGTHWFISDAAVSRWLQLWRRDSFTVGYETPNSKLCQLPLHTW